VVYGEVVDGSNKRNSAMGIAGLTTGHLVVTSDVSIRFITNSKRE
jgi:hypothetical protein